MKREISGENGSNDKVLIHSRYFGIEYHIMHIENFCSPKNNMHGVANELKSGKKPQTKSQGQP